MNISTVRTAACALTAALVLVACEDGNVKKLKTDVAVAQASAPLEAGMMGAISSVSYDAGDNAVTFTFSPSPEGLDSAFVSTHAEAVMPVLQLALNRGPQAEVFSQMGQAGASAQISYGSTPVIGLSAETIKNMLANPITGRDAAVTELQGYAMAQTATCPRQLVPGIELTGVTVSETALCYEVRLDGTVWKPSALPAAVPELRHALWTDMKQRAAAAPSGRSLYRQLFDNSMGVDYVLAQPEGTVLSFPYKEIYFLTK